jgi:hypothetical protein
MTVMKPFSPLSRSFAICALVAAGVGGAVLAKADVFELAGPGELRGELLNKDENPRTKYVVKTPLGGKVTLDVKQVKRVVRQSASEIEYDRERLKYSDTADDQWKLSEWCREKQLAKQRKTHLERVVELDANHAKAHRGLGHVQSQGRWMTPEQLKAENGWVKYRGQWRLVQDVEILEQKRKAELAEKDWAQKITRWRKWLDTDEKADQGESNLLGITDPMAAQPLAARLARETDRDIKLLFVDALCRLPEGAGMDAVLKTAIEDRDEEVRIVSLERLSEANYRPAVSYFIGLLKSKDNVLVNRAGAGLAHMKDPIAIEPLIDALITTHKYKVVKGNPNQTSATFGSGAPGGFSFGGGGEEIVTRNQTNKNVLDALILLTGGVNFDFDVEAWRSWYALQKKPAAIDTRRDRG